MGRGYESPHLHQEPQVTDLRLFLSGRPRALWGRSGTVRAAAKWSKAAGATRADYVGLRIQ